MKTVAVIGLGPAGLTNVKELKAAGFDVQGFDRSREVGGRWSLDSSIDTGVWRELFMNTTRRFMEFSDFEWPEDNTYPGREKAYKNLYPHCSETTSYLKAYAKHFDLYPCLNLETEVKKVELSEDKQRWKLIIQSRSASGDGAESSKYFDALVVSSGTHAKPFHPLQETLNKFTGKVLHSINFHSVKDYEKQRVLVIGSGISGGDISAALATEGTCTSVTNSVRHVPYHITKFSQTQKGVPMEVAMFNRLPCWLSRFLPDSICSMGLKKTLLANFPTQLTTDKGAWEDPDPDIRLASVSYTANYIECFEKGKISLKPAVASANLHTVTFVDGTNADFDVVICATGYEQDFSFLPSEVMDKITYTNIFTGKKEIAIYKHTLVPDMENLAFAGSLEGIGSPFPPFEVQARYIAALWAGKISRPTAMQLQKGIDSFKKFRESHRFHAYELCAEFGEQLADELGITPSYLDAAKNPNMYLFSPIYACYYRSNPKVDGEELARSSRARFERYLTNPVFEETGELDSSPPTSSPLVVEEADTPHIDPVI